MKQILILVVLLIAGNVHAELTTMEKRIVEEVNKSSEEAILLLERVVNINSGTMNQEGVRRVGDLFRKEFDGIGFETKWISMPKEMNRAGHLFAEREGNQGKRLLLIGHLDTVFEKESRFLPFTRNGSTAKGQGVNDMKGGDVVALYALKALHRLGLLENAGVIVAFTGDEEKPGDPISISRKDLIEAAKRTDVALGFESAEGLNTGTIARRGINGWRLEVKGTQAHSSSIFTEASGSGAIFEAARILNAFHQQLRGEQYLTFSPGVILGGTEVSYESEFSRGTAFGKTNVIARTVIVEGDLRFISDEQKDKIQAKMQEIVKQSLPGTTATITFARGYPSMSPTEGNLRLLKLLDQVSRDLGYPAIEPFDPAGRGAADISFVSSLVDSLDGLGAMGLGGHTPDEDTDLKTLPILIQRAAVLMYRLTRM